jgi:hypothetical protein
VGHSNPSPDFLGIFRERDSRIKIPNILVPIELGIFRDVRRIALNHLAWYSAIQPWN